MQAVVASAPRSGAVRWGSSPLGSGCASAMAPYAFRAVPMGVWDVAAFQLPAPSPVLSPHGTTLKRRIRQRVRVSPNRAEKSHHLPLGREEFGDDSLV